MILGQNWKKRLNNSTTPTVANLAKHNLCRSMEIRDRLGEANGRHDSDVSVFCLTKY